MPSTSRPVFDSYSLPLPERREGPAAALSFAAHVAIALLVLWRGAELFQGSGGGGTGPRGGGGGGGRPAVSWLALPTPSVPQADDVPPAPAVTVPTVAAPVTEPVKLDVPLPVVAIAPPAAVGPGEGTAGGPGKGPGSGGGTGTGTGTGSGSDAGPGSGGDASDIFAATPRWAIIPPPGAPREARGRHEVRFWVTVEGRVTRIDVTPPIKDAGYRREFTERMMGYLFNPATTRDGRHVEYVASLIVYP
ncbi:MAG TPA: hypothetical protein VGJ80_02200 [Gemmatimonadales bacterium]